MAVIAHPDPLGKVIDLAKYLSEPAWNLEGCALVGQQIYDLAVTAQQQHRGAVEALHRAHAALDAEHGHTAETWADRERWPAPSGGQ